MTDRYAAKATRLIEACPGQFRRVPAYVAAPPRKRGGLADWLQERRSPQEAGE